MAAPHPVVLATLAALFFALSSILVRSRVRASSPMAALAISLTVNVVLLWTVAVAWYDVTVDLWGWRYFVIAGVLSPMLGRFFIFAGIDRLGVNLAVPISYMNPLVSVSLAMAFLGETISSVGLTGGLLVIAGGVVLGTVRGDGPVAFERKHLLLPAIAAAAFGGSHVFRKVGIDLGFEPVVAAAVTATTSWVLLVAYLAARRDRQAVAASRSAALAFAGSGVASAVALPALFLALQLGDVVLVTPLMNTTPLFVLGLSYLAFREEELFTPRVVAGTLGIVVGITLLTVFGTG